MVLPSKVWGDVFPETTFREGTNYFGQKIYGDVVLSRRTKIRSYQNLGGVSWMRNAFSSNLNTVNLHLKIKPWPFLKIIKAFILKVLIVKRSQKLCHVQFPLCWLWPEILTYFLKVKTRNREDELEKTPFALCLLGTDFMQVLWPGGKWID